MSRPRGPVETVVVVVLVVAAVAVGAAAVVAGEADDSPGLQGLGVLLAVGAVALGVRRLRRRDAPQRRND